MWSHALSVVRPATPDGHYCTVAPCSVIAHVSTDTGGHGVRATDASKHVEVHSGHAEQFADEKVKVEISRGWVSTVVISETKRRTTETGSDYE